MESEIHIVSDGEYMFKINNITDPDYVIFWKCIPKTFEEKIQAYFSNWLNEPKDIIDLDEEIMRLQIENKILGQAHGK